MQATNETMTPYHTITPYVIVPDAENFLSFMKKVFQATEQRREEAPGRGIVHCEVVIGDSVIMFAEATEKWKACTTGIFILVQDADQSYHVALKEGAVSLGEPSDQSYGRSAGVQDPFGNTWWITSMP